MNTNAHDALRGLKTTELAAPSAVQTLFDSVNSKVTGDRLANPELGKSFATESFASMPTTTRESINTTLGNLRTVLQTGYQEFGKSFAVESLTQEAGKQAQLRDDLAMMTPAQLTAGLNAAMLAMSPRDYLGRTLAVESHDPSATNIQPVYVHDAVAGRSLAAESYSEQDNRNAISYAITYNMIAARQDLWGETLWPTITIPSEQTAIQISANLFWVMENYQRDIGGKAADFKRRHLVRAIANSEILKKEQTLNIPQVRPQSADAFVDPAIIADHTQVSDGVEYTTNYLKFGRSVDIIGISTRDHLINGQSQNQTDDLDGSVDVTGIAVQIGDDILHLGTDHLAGRNFVPALQGEEKGMNLNLNTSAVQIRGTAKQIDDTDLVSLKALTDRNLRASLRLVMTGTGRTDTANIEVFCNKLELINLRNADGSYVPETDSDFIAIKALIANCTPLGYKQASQRTNANRRIQGDFIDVSRVLQRYTVPFRSPITARHPAHVDGQIDTTDVQALVTATRVKQKNESVTQIINFVDMMQNHIDSMHDDLVEDNGYLGIGRHYVVPQFTTSQWHGPARVDSLSHKDRSLDIQASLVAELRDVVFNLYTNSEYQAGADVLSGGNGPIPEVIVATDPVTARYLNVTGDLRLLGGEFNVRIVTTLDRRWRGKIFVTFGIFDDKRNTQVNPLNFGNLFWSSELVLTANISRDGQYSRETMAMPRYLYAWHLPVGALIEVSGISEVLGKLPLKVEGKLEIEGLPTGP